MKRYLLFLSVMYLVGTASVGAGNDAATKLARGMNNSLFGWFEIVNEIGNASDKRGFWVGFPEGILRGTVLGVLRIGAGAFETLSFPFPNGKKGYDAIVMPESPFDRR